MNGDEATLALCQELRARLDSARSGEPLDADAALGELDRLESAIGLLRLVSIHSFGEFEHRIQELSLLARIGALFASIFEPERLARDLIDLVCEAVPCENAFLWVPEGAAGLGASAATGPETGEGDLGIACRAAALAAGGEELVCIPDVASDARFEERAPDARIRSLVASPLTAAGESLGAIVLSECEADAFTPARTRALRSVADLAALAIRHARVCRKNVEHGRRLEELVEERTREVNEARAALSQQERAAAMGKLAASIAHEVNNPMSYLVSNLQRARDYTDEIEAGLPLLLDVLEKSLRLPDSEDEDVARAREAAARAVTEEVAEKLTSLVADFGELIAETREGTDRIRSVGENLRSFAHGITGLIEPVDLNRVVETVLHIVRTEAKNRIDFECRFGVLPDVLCHRYKITQVLLNLIQNAVEAIEETGAVRIETRSLGAWVEVSVADDGPGVALEQVDRIFEPFLTTKLGGTGLGLSISREIVNAHRGTLEVETGPEGSVFRLRLPTRGPENAPGSEG